MEFPVYDRRIASKSEFLRFWSSAYRYKDENVYEDNIGKELTPDRIETLFRWKNGMPLSETKAASIEQNFIQRSEELDAFRQACEPRAFLDHFDKGGAVWRIFWLHCFSPERFPIFDQHVNRAMTYLQGRTLQKITASEYIRAYLPFYEGFTEGDRREADKALWAFGKFLKSWNFPDQSART